MTLLYLKLLLLIGIANGAPIIATRLLGKRFAWPVDGGARFIDGQALFGRSKTWRGLIFAVLAACAAAPLLELNLSTGLIVGLCSMAGDLFSSFIKRRLHRPPSSQAIGLDQIPECLLPLVAVQPQFALGWSHIGLLVAGFVILELALSRVLYHLKIRKQPY